MFGFERGLYLYTLSLSHLSNILCLSFFPSLTSSLPPYQTYIGNVLVAVNPYEELDIYSDAFLGLYFGTSMFELPPHM